MAIDAKADEKAGRRGCNLRVHLLSKTVPFIAKDRKAGRHASTEEKCEYKPTPLRIRSPWFLFVAGNLLLSIAAFLGILAVQTIVHLEVDCCTLFVDVFVALGLVAVCASVPVTHFVGGYWRYAALGWAFWQPFVGGFRFVLFQALSWCLYSMALVLVTMPLLPPSLLPHSLMPRWMLPTLVTGGGASALLAEMLMVSSLLTFQGGPGVFPLKGDASQPLDRDNEGSGKSTVTSAARLASLPSPAVVEATPSPAPPSPSPSSSSPPHVSGAPSQSPSLLVAEDMGKEVEEEVAEVAEVAEEMAEVVAEGSSGTGVPGALQPTAAVREAELPVEGGSSSSSTEEQTTEPCSPFNPGSDPLGASEGSSHGGHSGSCLTSTVASAASTGSSLQNGTVASSRAPPHAVVRHKGRVPARPPRPLLRTLWMRFMAGLVITVLYTPHYLFLLMLALPFGLLPFQWAMFIHTVLLTPYVAFTYRGTPQLNGRRCWCWIRDRVVAIMEEAADLYFGGMAIIVDGDSVETTQEGELELPGGAHVADVGGHRRESSGEAGAVEAGEDAPVAEEGMRREMEGAVGRDAGDGEGDGSQAKEEAGGHARVASQREPPVVFLPDKKYVYGYHPHGLYPVTLGWFHMTAAWKRRLPGISPVALAASVIFFVPFLRDLFMWSGARDVSRRAFRAALKEQNAVVLCPGGQKELIEFSRNGTDAGKISVYARHTGFVREALLANATLVPVFCFGETRLLHNLIHWPAAQSWTYKLLGFPMPFIPAGMGGFLPLPRRRVPVHVVVGKPIDPPPFTLVDGHVPPDVVKSVHRQYYKALASLFERYKVQCDHAGVELELVGLPAEA